VCECVRVCVCERARVYVCVAFPLKQHVQASHHTTRTHMPSHTQHSTHTRIATHTYIPTHCNTHTHTHALQHTHIPTQCNTHTHIYPHNATNTQKSHTQVIELDDFKVTHASRYPAPILSLGLSPDCGTLAVGMADGTFSMRRHDRPRAITVGPSAAPVRRKKYGPKLTAANFRCARCLMWMACHVRVLACACVCVPLHLCEYVRVCECVCLCVCVCVPT